MRIKQTRHIYYIKKCSLNLANSKTANKWYNIVNLVGKKYYLFVIGGDMAKQEWLKCDMHMHSYHSKPKDHARVKQMTAQEYVDTLLQKGVKIFSITDHNVYSSAYYGEIKEYIKDKDIAVINGVELDVYVDTKNDTYFQMGVYFDGSVEDKNLEDVIATLYKDDSKPKFVEILNSVATLGCKFIIIPEGDKARGITTILNKVSPEEIKEINKYAMYKVFNAFDVTKSFDEKSINIWANNFYKKSVSFENIVRDKNTQEMDDITTEVYKKIKDSNHELKSEEAKDIYDYAIKYGHYFAYFTFSDWHNAEVYKPEINNFIFGSIDLYFEAFELAVLDPVSRIIKTTEDSISIPPNILKQVGFSIGGKKQTIKFSPGLNVIIGKRGSGKSLLLAAIENLNDQQSTLLKSYGKLNISDISAIDYNDIEIGSGQLSSLAVLKQDQITDIYNNPSLANSSISSFFPHIEPYDKSYLEKITAVARKVTPYNKNYKNLTSILTTLKNFDYFSFRQYPDLQYDDIVDRFESTLTDIKTLINDIGSLGLNPEPLLREEEKLEKIYNEYEIMLSKYKSIIDTNNNKIRDILSKRNANQKVISEQKNNLEKILSDIYSNFSILLNLKKLEYLLDNARFDNPKLRKRKKGNYLFIASYSVPEDLMDSIWENLTSTISKVKGDTGDIDLIKKYVNGEKFLKSGLSNLSSDLSRYINDDIFKPKKGFYKVALSFDEKDIETHSDLVKNIENKNIQDLSTASPGMKSVAYLDMLFDLGEAILLFDQPEDNIDNDYISKTLVSIIKDKKKTKQLIFVTHNPSLAVYGDAFNYIYVKNDGEIVYDNYFIEKAEDKEKIMNILEGGRPSFANRDKKYGSILGEEEYGNS
ncbi:MAG: hypothetical protein PWQ10_495 [Patescibacteria group bacterium]|nr:hypothetical protein [Patescibacteria group bacterium]